MDEQEYESSLSRIMQEALGEFRKELEPWTKLENKDIAEKLQEKEEELEKIPFCHLPDYGKITESTEEWVPVKLIVGSVSPAVKNWKDEYHGRKGKHQKISQALIEAFKTDNLEQQAEVIARIFGINLYSSSMGSSSIEVIKMQGPQGPVYFVRDGTHRTGAMKMLGLKKIPCKVYTVQPPKSAISEKEQDGVWWKELIEKGLIEGEVQDITNLPGFPPSYESKKLRIKKQSLPWCYFPKKEFRRMSEIYRSLYPNFHFTNLKGEKVSQNLLFHNQ